MLHYALFITKISYIILPSQPGVAIVRPVELLHLTHALVHAHLQLDAGIGHERGHHFAQSRLHFGGRTGVRHTQRPVDHRKSRNTMTGLYGEVCNTGI